VATTADKPMDLVQASQRIAWLDEERRRDHAELARLSQELAAALAVIKDQTVKQREMGDRINAIEAALSRLPHLEDAITQTRAGLVPLREADVRLQDEIERQAKNRQSETDQLTRLLGDMNTRLDATIKSIDGLANRLHGLETQRQELADRVNEIPGRLEALAKIADGLANRLQAVETQQKSLASRMNELPAQLDALSKTADGLAGRIKLVETQQRDLFNRMNEVPVQLDTLRRAADTLASRIQLLETQHKTLTERTNELVLRLDGLVKTDEGLAARIQLLETRDEDHVAHRASVQAQIARLEASQMQVAEEAKRAVLRAESPIADVQQIRKDLAAAQDENAKQHREHIVNLTEQKEAVAAVQRQVDEVRSSLDATKSEIERLSENTFLIAEAAHRLTAIEEHLAVIESAYKAYQETQDTRWGVEIPEIRNMIEEASNMIQTAAATIQELVASNQALKEDMRVLRVDLAEERIYSEDLAAALRGLIEEDVQNRLVMAQKQLLNIRRLANAPVEGSLKNE